MDKDILYQYLLILGDQSMILGHRLSELCGHGPTLETDIAFTNISLDLFGEVRNYFQYAASISNANESEDSIAFLRTEREHYNAVLLEQPNVDFAHIIVRQFLFDVYHMNLLEELTKSTDDTLRAIAVKSKKEANYHLRFSENWLKRLIHGTTESHEKVKNAVEHLYPLSFELHAPTMVERKMAKLGVGVDLDKLSTPYLEYVTSCFSQIRDFDISSLSARTSRGKEGYHSEHLGHILCEFQYMQRAYPQLEW